MYSEIIIVGEIPFHAVLSIQYSCVPHAIQEHSQDHRRFLPAVAKSLIGSQKNRENAWEKKTCMRLF